MARFGLAAPVGPSPAGTTLRPAAADAFSTLNGQLGAINELVDIVGHKLDVTIGEYSLRAAGMPAAHRVAAQPVTA